MKNKLTRSRSWQPICNNLVHLSFLSNGLNEILKINLGRRSALVTVTFSAAAAASPIEPLLSLLCLGPKMSLAGEKKKERTV